MTSGKMLIALTLIALALLGLVVYRSCSRPGLDVAPDAREQIEKAKHR